VQSPEPADGNIFVGQSDGTVAALDPATGNVRWSPPAPNGPLAAGPGVALAPDGDELDVQAIDRNTGQARWSAALASPPFPVPGASRPNGFTIAYSGVLPSSAAVFFVYGNRLGG
jgi:outer membrane protein assembly factor BamB